MFNFTSKLADQVEQVLEDYPAARDSDETLVYVYVHLYTDTPQISLADWLRKVKRGELPSYSSLSRTRRRVQKEHPHLRGRKYDHRQAVQREAQKQLGYNIK